MSELADFAWLDGKIVPWGQATLHVNTLCTLAGINAYDVFRGYWSEEAEDLFFFRIEEHLNRLDRSMKAMRLQIPFSRDDLKQAAVDLVRANRFREDVSVRLVAYVGQGRLFGYRPGEVETGAFVLAFRAPVNPATSTGIHCCVSSWQRLDDVAQPPRVKSGANYQNVRLAQMQAFADGYDEPILLNHDGKVAEAAIRNIFLVRSGVPITPSITSGILEGVTRQTLIELFERELGLPVQQREVDRTELYIADEVFLSSTSSEVIPVLSVDRYPVGDGRPGPLSRKIYEVTVAATRGKNPRYRDWLTPVGIDQPATPPT